MGVSVESLGQNLRVLFIVKWFFEPTIYEQVPSHGHIYVYSFWPPIDKPPYTLSPPATLYLSTTNEAGQQGIEVC
jgi:hypothetical protein